MRGPVSKDRGEPQTLGVGGELGPEGSCEICRPQSATLRHSRSPIMADPYVPHHPSLARLLVQPPGRRQVLATCCATESPNPHSQTGFAGLAEFICLFCLQCLSCLSGAA